MYRINPLKRDVLITSDEVIFHMPSVQTIDPRQILQQIIIAEERFISKALCEDFYEDFIEKKNKIVTAANRAELLIKINDSLILEGSKPITEDNLPIGIIVNAIEFVDDENYVKLWNRILWKLTAECVDFIGTVPSWLRHTSQGQQMNNPKTLGGSETDVASGDVKDIRFKLDTSIQDRISPLMESMHNWICKRKESFPLYCKECVDCGCGSSGDHNSFTKGSNFITGLYD